jgi:CBS domain-containing protein
VPPRTYATGVAAARWFRERYFDSAAAVERYAMPQRPIRNLIAKQKILTATAEITVAEAARLMKKKNVAAVMVVKDNGQLSGIFTERDAVFRVLAEGRDPKTTRLADVMTSHPQTIAPDKPVGHALLMMHEAGFRHVPVVENGKPVGMVSARDALGFEIQEFESEVQRRTRIGEILG